MSPHVFWFSSAIVTDYPDDVQRHIEQIGQYVKDTASALSAWIAHHPNEFIIAVSAAITALFTGILAIATIRLWNSTAELARLAKRQADDMKDSIAASKTSADAASKSANLAETALFVGQRPYVFVTRPHFRDTISLDTFNFDPQAPPVWPTIKYPLENHGQTPAIIIEVCAESLFEASLPDIPEYRENRIYGDLGYILGVGDKRAPEFVFKTPITGRVMNDVATGASRLYAFGYVKYEDIFGYIHTVGFCWRYQLIANRFLPEAHKAYNYRNTEQAPSK